MNLIKLTELARSQPVFDHQFLLNFSSGVFTNVQMGRMLTAFGHHVKVFTSVLGHLIGVAPTVEARAALLHNLSEELGHGNATKAHYTLYRNMLRSIGAPDVEDTDAPHAVAMLNAGLMEAVNTSFVHGLAWLGLGGELTIPNNFGYLRAGLELFVPKADLSFFDHHGAPDENHADDANALLKLDKASFDTISTVRREMLRSLWAREQVWRELGTL